MKPTTIRQTAAVRYTVAVIDADGRVVSQRGPKRNLILDSGLNALASTSWTDQFQTAHVGTGTTPTKRDSGAVTFTRTGSTVTASAGFFEAADVGRLLRFDTGEEVRITAYSDAQTVTTADSGSIAASEGTVWYVNQTALISQSKTTSTYATTGGANGSSFASGVWTHKRTFLFSAEAGSVTYREIGWSASGGSLFGRDLLAGVGVSLIAGQQLRVTVELSVTYSQLVSTAFGDVGSGGFATTGACGIENVGQVGKVNTNGSSSSVNMLDPGGSPGRQIGLATGAAAIADAVSSGDSAAMSGVVDSQTATSASYVTGAFARSFAVTFGVSAGNSTALRSIYFHSGNNRPTYRVLTASSQTKTADQTLRIEFTLSWGRTLVN